MVSFILQHIGLSPKAVNVESKNAPKRLRLILIERNPNWDIPQRWITKYWKRNLKEKKDSSAYGIDVRTDESSLSPSTSSRLSREKDPQDNLYLPNILDTGFTIKQDIEQMFNVEDVYTDQSVNENI